MAITNRLPVLPVRYGIFVVGSDAMSTATVVVSPASAATVVPAPVPMSMARSVSAEDIELLTSQIWPSLVGMWKVRAPVPVPGAPPCCCCTMISESNYLPLADDKGGYPFDVKTNVKCCCCCPLMSETTNGLVSSDGTTISATDSKGYASRGTLAEMDANSKKVTYQLTGSSAQGTMSGTSVVEPGTWIDTIHVGGRTMVFVFSKM